MKWLKSTGLVKPSTSYCLGYLLIVHHYIEKATILIQFTFYVYLLPHTLSNTQISGNQTGAVFRY